MKTVIIFSGLIISIMFLLSMNYGVLSYREKELAYNLDVISIRQGDGDSMGLLSRYLLIKKKMERGAEAEEDYLLEARLQGVLASIHGSSSGEKAEEGPASGGPVEAVVKIYLSGIRAVLGKESPEEAYAVYNDQLMELAYFYERYRMYGKALEVMNNITKRRKNLNPFTRRTILLHSGFCHAMLSESEPAIKSYSDVITYYPGSREAATAAILLEYLRAVDEGADTVMKLDLAKNKKAEKLYFLSSYGRSMKLFEEYFATAKKGTEVYARAKFYYARAAEESGNKEAAVAAYRDLAANGNSGEWGAKSDQRMLVLDTFYRDSGKPGEQPPPAGRREGSGEFADKIGKIQSLVHTENFALQKAESGYGEFLKRNEDVGMASAPEDREIRKLEAEIRPGGPEIASITSVFKDSVEKSTAGTSKKSSEKLPDMVSVITKDGFLFEGELVKTTSKGIVLRSEFGDIPIGRNQIKTISKSIE